MRLNFGVVSIAVLLVAGTAGSADWLTRSEAGLRQLMNGTISANSLSNVTLDPTAVVWHAPGTGTGEQTISMSEREWLNLPVDLAPVSYLDVAPASPAATPGADQQPL